MPEGYEERGAHDIALHFHGHNTTLDATLNAHRYEEHVCGSGANVVLVVPQGPVNAASGNFGKLMTPAGTLALIDDVLVTLYRADLAAIPNRGEVILTAHSGGYRAVAANALAPELRVAGVHLYDALYGELPTYTDYARGGGALRSNYTATGGTRTNNEGLVATLRDGTPAVPVETSATLPNLRDAPALIDFTLATHRGATRHRNAFAERLRFSAPRGIAGGRIELRHTRVVGAQGVVSLLAPPDPDRVAIEIVGTQVGGASMVLATLAPDAREATFPWTGVGRVVARSRMPDDEIGASSDAYPLSAGARVLVVDSFERVLGGSFSGREHDFAARIGEAVPTTNGALGASGASRGAVETGEVALSDYDVVVWLAGDQSVDDEPISASARALLDAFVSGGGALIVSGSEVGFALPADPFLQTLGATYVSDDAGVTRASGAGALAAIAAFDFGTDLAPYPEDFPDVLSARSGAQVLLTYEGGAAAAVGVPGSAALVGFPLETIVSDATLREVLAGLIEYVL